MSLGNTDSMLSAPTVNKRRFSDTALTRLCLPTFSAPSTILSRAQESYEYRRDRRRLRAQLESFRHSSSPTSTVTAPASSHPVPPPIPPKSSARFSGDEQRRPSRPATFAGPTRTSIGSRGRSGGGGGSGSGSVADIIRSPVVGRTTNGGPEEEQQPTIFRERIFGSLRRRNSNRTSSNTDRVQSVDVRDVGESSRSPAEFHNSNHGNIYHKTNGIDSSNGKTDYDIYDHLNEKPHAYTTELVELDTHVPIRAYSPLEIITPSDDMSPSNSVSTATDQSRNDYYFPTPRYTTPDKDRPGYHLESSTSSTPAHLHSHTDSPSKLDHLRTLSFLFADPLVPPPVQSRRAYAMQAQVLAAQRPWWATIQAQAQIHNEGRGQWRGRRDDPMFMTDDPWTLPPLVI